jgi:hypothetical protein
LYNGPPTGSDASALRWNHMPEVGEYADTLRAVGRMLDGLNASDIALSDTGAGFALAWRDSGRRLESHEFDEHELSALRESARAARERETKAGAFPHAEQLRALGSMVDEIQAAGVVIKQLPGGFWLAADLDGETITETLSVDQVRLRSRIGQLRRASGGLALH